MKIILGAIKEFNDDALIMARQLGAEGFHFNTPPIATSDENYWTERSLRWLKEYTEKFELKLEMIENVPIRFFDKILPRKREFFCRNQFYRKDSCTMLPKGV